MGEVGGHKPKLMEFHMDKSTIKRFNALNLDAINGIKDAELRTKAFNLKAKQKGFTLLELLVVVTILAVIGGAMISSFGGQEAKAARGVATSTIAGIEDAMRIFTVTEGVLPDSLEALTCEDFGATDHPTVAQATADINAPATWAGTEGVSKFGGASDLPGIGGGMGAKLAGKFNVNSLPADAGQALINAGITTLRVAEGTACDTDAATPSAAIGSAPAPFPADSLAEMNIPQHAFETPRPGSFQQRNRGRGFERTVSFNGATTPALLVWSRGTDGYNNVKIGGSATDVLVGLGLGQASTAVGNDNSPFAKAPFYGQVAKDKYPHYVLLVKVGEDDDGTDLTTGFDKVTNATIKAVIDPRGDFLDEEFAEFTGQKT